MTQISYRPHRWQRRVRLRGVLDRGAVRFFSIIVDGAICAYQRKGGHRVTIPLEMYSHLNREITQPPIQLWKRPTAS